MEKIELIRCIEEILSKYKYDSNYVNSQILFCAGAEKGVCKIGCLTEIYVLDIICENEFSKQLTGEAEKKRFEGASLFSRYTNSHCYFSYSPPGKYIFSTRLLINKTSAIEDVAKMFEYCLCASIEGYNFLDSDTYYENERNEMFYNRQFQINLHGRTPWQSPGYIWE